MLEVINYQDLTGRAEEIEEHGAQVFKLEVESLHFGFLYLTPATYTLAWNGLLDFGRVDAEAAGFLYQRLDEQKKSFLEISHYRFETMVSLIIRDRLFKYTLNDPNQRNQYREMLRDGGSISFIRYDFIVRESPLRFSFTAENPHNTPANDCELAVMLPRSQPISEGLLRWVISHHASFQKQRIPPVNLKASGSKLSRLVWGDFDSANWFAFG